MKADLRASYDLETLWTVGAQYDEQSKKELFNPLEVYDFSGLAVQEDSNASFTSAEIQGQESHTVLEKQP